MTDNPNKLSLPDGAIPPRRAGLWTEIELFTPTDTSTRRQQHVAAFSPPSIIPELSVDPNAFSAEIVSSGEEEKDLPHASSNSCECCRVPVTLPAPPHASSSPTSQTPVHPKLESLLLTNDTKGRLNPFDDATKVQTLHPSLIQDTSSQTQASTNSPGPLGVPVLRTPLIENASLRNFSSGQADTGLMGTIKIAKQDDAWRALRVEENRKRPVCGASGSSRWPVEWRKMQTLQIILFTKLLCLYPILFYVLLRSITDTDWRHVDIRYDVEPGVQSRTTLSLTAVARLTETASSALPAAAASVRELPVPYNDILKSMSNRAGEKDMFCDEDSQKRTAEMLLGPISLKEALEGTIANNAQINNLRVVRLAIYHIMHGPTFRDVDCRHLKSFRYAGKITLAMMTLALTLLSVEWILLLLHAVSQRRAAETNTILSLLKPRQKQQQTISSPELSSPRMMRNTALTATVTAPAQILTQPLDRESSWACIDLTGRNNTHPTHLRRPLFPLTTARQLLRKWRTCILRRDTNPSRLHNGNERCCGMLSGGTRRQTQVCVLGDTDGRARTTDWMWWKPLRWLQQCFHFRPADHPKSLFFCESFLGGSTMLLSTATVLCLLVGATTWSTQTKEAACLNEETSLQPCSMGHGYTLLIVAIGMTLGLLYTNYKTPSLWSKIEDLKDKDMNRHQHESAQTN